MIIIAHNIRSMHNVGSIFRNAAAFNIEKLCLTGITATPPRKEIAKVALGAENLVNWVHGDITETITNLKQDGFTVYGLETGEDALEIHEAVRTLDASKLALILGHEADGIDKETLALTDGIIQIEMGKKRSLNVSVASGVAMYAFLEE